MPDAERIIFIKFFELQREQAPAKGKIVRCAICDSKCALYLLPHKENFLNELRNMNMTYMKIWSNTWSQSAKERMNNSFTYIRVILIFFGFEHFSSFFFSLKHRHELFACCFQRHTCCYNNNPWILRNEIRFSLFFLFFF